LTVFKRKLWIPPLEAKLIKKEVMQKEKHNLVIEGK
jgi:hypothetical protein